MIDYARRNWSNCRKPPTDGCHTRYHFADVAIQRDGYSRSFFGTGNDDIVSALDSAVLVLQFQPAEPPISIRDKKEALLLIAHLVGDLHQPLHVGAVYLRPDGSLTDPDTPANQNPGTIEKNNATHGGTDILIEGRANLHAMWDDVPHDWGRNATPELLAKAKAVPPSKANVDMLAALWAGETVRLSNDAFKGLTFGNQERSRQMAGHRRQRFPLQDEAREHAAPANHQGRRQAGRAAAGDLAGRIGGDPAVCPACNSRWDFFFRLQAQVHCLAAAAVAAQDRAVGL